MNLYIYCANNPVIFLDPSGRQSILEIESMMQMGYDSFYEGVSPEYTYMPPPMKEPKFTFSTANKISNIVLKQRIAKAIVNKIGDIRQDTEMFEGSAIITTTGGTSPGFARADVGTAKVIDTHGDYGTYAVGSIAATTGDLSIDGTLALTFTDGLRDTYEGDIDDLDIIHKKYYKSKTYYISGTLGNPGPSVYAGRGTAELIEGTKGNLFEDIISRVKEWAVK